VSHDAPVGTCVGDFPLALVPLWQEAHEPGVTSAWLKVAGTQPLVRWQESQAAVVAMWVDGLPREFEPLWHEAHDPGETLAWLKRAGVHPVDRWQESHDPVVGMWVAGLPDAVTVLWQLAQVPGATPRWLKRAPENLIVPWQDSHPAFTGMWPVEIVTLGNRLPCMWQLLQSRGVPLNTPFRWQFSHFVWVCAPVSGKPVVRWLKSFARMPCAKLSPDKASAVNSSNARVAASRVVRGDSVVGFLMAIYLG
jgi:hypothetical protein